MYSTVSVNVLPEPADALYMEREWCICFRICPVFHAKIYISDIIVVILHRKLRLIRQTSEYTQAFPMQSSAMASGYGQDACHGLAGT